MFRGPHDPTVESIAMHRRRSHIFLIQALLMALLGLLAAIPATSAQTTSTPASDGEMTPVQVVDQVAPAVVTVINEQTVSNGLGSNQQVPAGAGTGFIIDDQGHIVTNWHVVTGGTSFKVILYDGTQLDAKLVGEDPRDDLAVVQIDASKVPGTVSLGDSSQLKPGQSVLAMGSPLGEFGNTVTAGIVSALNRNQLGQEGLCQNYTDLIQHDAAINPGNSGGPLFNLKGEVVGVNTLGIPSQQGQPVQGLFFAVPSNTVKVVVDQIIQTGGIKAPYLGITFVALNPQISSVNGISVDHGLYVQDVESGGPADQAGIQADDIILQIEGDDITPSSTLSSHLLNYQPGDTVTLTILRGDQQSEVQLTFGEAPQSVFEQCTLQGQP
jgi:2-alkenal reductase